ncbi:hypothetical protein [Streptomyces sp. NPDC006274]|uniref:hypothetical protein n=1 Tax=unclassified Streptomyces TaxID=2593676 RepID=UPI00339FB0BF
MSASRVTAAFAALGAAAIHFASAPDHYGEWWPAGTFFYAVGAFQTGWAVAALRRPGPVVMLLGLLGNAGVTAIWAVSRTVGFPVGPGAGVPEDIGRAGITAGAFQAVICLVALWHVKRRNPRGFASSVRAVLVVGAASAAVVALTMPAVETAMTHSHGHGTAEDSAPHEDGPDTGKPATPRGGEADPTSPGSSTPEPGEPASSGEPADPGHDDEPHGH